MISWSHTASAGTNTYLLVAVVATSATGPNTVTFGAAGLTLINQYAPGGNELVEFYGLASPTPGTATITVTLFSNSRNIQGFASTIGGTDPVNRFGAVTSQNGNSSLPGANGIPAGTNDLVIDCVMQYRSNLAARLNLVAPQDLLGEDASSDTVVFLQAGSSRAQGATDMEWSSDVSDTWAMSVIPFKGSVGLVSDAPRPVAGRGATW